MKLYYLVLSLLLFCFACNTASKSAKPKLNNLTQEFIFEQPVTRNCHASTIVEVKPNHLMAAWFGGTEEGAKDVGIYYASHTGTSWSSPQSIIQPLVTETDTFPCWNPVLFKSQSNRLYLFYKVGKNPREWFGAMITSTDDGKTWSDITYLPEGMLGPIRNKPIEIEKGVILCGSSTENKDTDEWRVHIEFYTEADDQWEKVTVPNSKNFEVIQPTFLLHGNNKIQMLCRSKHDRLITSWSEDAGRSWSDMDSVSVVNANSGVDAVTLNHQSFLLVNNPLPRGTNWYNGRNVLDLEYSTDGKLWEKLLDFEKHEKGEFSYPAIIQSSDGKIHVTYTYDREYMKHVVFEMEEITL